VAGTIVVISYTSPIFIAVFVPLSLLYWFVQNVYVATSRQLKRLESSTRSPIYSWFGEALNGVATIRAYGLQDKFTEELEQKVDLNQVRKKNMSNKEAQAFCCRRNGLHQAFAHQLIRDSN
jgi:ATP-binding cassette subfamily C (CFTR/MRP) protein 1